jgi:hypothetical protein
MVTSNDSNTNQQTAVTPDAGQIDEVVQQAITQIRSVYQILPALLKTPADGSKGMGFASYISDEFLEASVVAVENDTTFQATTGLDPATARQVITRSLRFEPIAAAADALARDIRYNMTVERRDLVQQALQVYGLAKVYSRRPHGVSLVSHMKAMQNALGRSGRSRKAQPSPAPPTPPQQLP